MKTLVHALFIIGVVAAGLAAGFLNMPGEWYASLAKPPFNPPNWLFGPVWTVLYVLIGWAGARSFLRRSEYPGTFGLWIAQFVLNICWTPVFFGMRNMVPGLVIILLLLAAVLAFIGRARHHDRLSAALFVPYALWVAFASLLNASLIYLN